MERVCACPWDEHVAQAGAHGLRVDVDWPGWFGHVVAAPVGCGCVGRGLVWGWCWMSWIVGGRIGRFVPMLGGIGAICLVVGRGVVLDWRVGGRREGGRGDDDRG